MGESCHIMSYHGRIMSYHVISWENHEPMENQVPYLPGPNLWGGEVVCSGGSEATTQSYLAPWIHDWERHLSYLRWTPPPATMFGSVFVQGRTWGSQLVRYWGEVWFLDIWIGGWMYCGNLWYTEKTISRVPKRGLSILWNCSTVAASYVGLPCLVLWSHTVSLVPSWSRQELRTPQCWRGWPAITSTARSGVTFPTPTPRRAGSWTMAPSLQGRKTLSWCLMSPVPAPSKEPSDGHKDRGEVEISWSFATIF